MVNGVFQGRNSIDGENNDSDKPSYSIFDTDKLDLLAHLIRAEIPMEELKTGWLQKADKIGNGYDILKWIKDHIEKDDDKAEEICQKMLDQGIILRVDEGETFVGQLTILYKFYEDREDIASNLLRLWNGEIENALDVSVSLLNDIGIIYKEAIVENDEEFIIEYEDALKSKKYDSFITKISQLELVNLDFSSFNEGLCFFLNVYQ